MADSNTPTPAKSKVAVPYRKYLISGIFELTSESPNSRKGCTYPAILKHVKKVNDLENLNEKRYKTSIKNELNKLLESGEIVQMEEVGTSIMSYRFKLNSNLKKKVTTDGVDKIETPPKKKKTTESKATKETSAKKSAEKKQTKKKTTSPKKPAVKKAPAAKSATPKKALAKQKSTTPKKAAAKTTTPKKRAAKA